MKSDQPDSEDTQTTDKGLEIPVPDREDFLKDLEKVAKKRTKDEPKQLP